MSQKTKTWLRSAFVVGIVLLALVALRTQLADAGDRLDDVSWDRLALSLVLACLSLISSSLAWSHLLKDMDTTVRTREAVPFFLFSQLGKYLPGGFGPALAQSSLAGTFRISKTAAANAYVVFAAQTVVVGLVVASVVLPFADPSLMADYWWAWSGGLVALPLLHPGILQRMLQLVVSRLRPGVIVPRLSVHSALVASIWTLCTWVLLGLHVAIVASAFEPLAPRMILLSVAGYCVAWVAGFVILFLPAGLGAREVVLVATLSTMIDTTDATVVAIVLRVVGSVGDVAVGLLAGGVLLLLRNRVGSHPDIEPSGTVRE